MLRYLRRLKLHCLKSVFVKSVLKFTWLNWCTLFCTPFFLYIVWSAWLSVNVYFVKLLPTSSSNFLIWHVGRKGGKKKLKKNQQYVNTPSNEVWFGKKVQEGGICSFSQLALPLSNEPLEWLETDKEDELYVAKVSGLQGCLVWLFS